MFPHVDAHTDAHTHEQAGTPKWRETQPSPASREINQTQRDGQHNAGTVQ